MNKELKEFSIDRSEESEYEEEEDSQMSGFLDEEEESQEIELDESNSVNTES